jgi:hypothetical protein
MLKQIVSLGLDLRSFALQSSYGGRLSALWLHLLRRQMQYDHLPCAETDSRYAFYMIVVDDLSASLHPIPMSIGVDRSGSHVETTLRVTTSG